MLEKLRSLQARYEELERLMAEQATNYEAFANYARERAELEEVVVKYRDYQEAQRHLLDARALLNDGSELAELARAEIDELEPRLEALERELKALLVPKDPRDNKNVIVEVRAGTGGDEAGLFAADLFRMYTRYAEGRGWKVDILSSNQTGVGGFKEIIFEVRGKGAYSRLKYESGVHRVQRVPATESQGRIHTSTATVAVLAEVDEVEIEIPERDVQLETYKSAGAGGQNVQKNMTAVRLTHLPTGMVITCQDERSLLQNKERAWSILRARLYEIETEKRRAEQAADRRSQVGTGERAEKIRTYNFPQSRVTDHRLSISSHNLPAVLDGQLDLFIDELAVREQVERLAEAVE